MTTADITTSGTMDGRRNAREKREAGWNCGPRTVGALLRREGSTPVGEHVWHDGMAPYRSEEMLCLLVLLARRKL